MGGELQGDAVRLHPPLLEGRQRYERVMEGWVDNTHDDALTHTVRLADPDRAIEVAVVASASPTYTIHEARCRALTRAAGPGPENRHAVGETFRKSR